MQAPDRIERNARLLCEARYKAGVQRLNLPVNTDDMKRYVDLSWDDVQFTARAEDLNAAGLTLVPVEPSEAAGEILAAIIAAARHDSQFGAEQAFAMLRGHLRDG